MTDLGSAVALYAANFDICGKDVDGIAVVSLTIKLNLITVILARVSFQTFLT